MHCKMAYIKYVISIDNPSSKAIGCEWVCVFVCSLTPPKQGTLMSWNFEKNDNDTDDNKVGLE